MDDEYPRKVHTRLVKLSKQQKRKREELVHTQRIEESKLGEQLHDEHKEKKKIMMENKRLVKEGREHMEEMLRDGEKREKDLLKQLP